MQSADDEELEFRYSRGERYTLGFVLGLLWLILLMMAGLAAELVATGAAVTGLFLLAMAFFFAALCRIVMRDFFMRNSWRIALGPANAWFHLPVWRVMFGPEPSLSGPLAYSAIAAIEWREEAASSLGLTAINRIYALRLKSGGVIILGEDRPIPDGGSYTRRAGDAARAIADKARAPVRQLPMAKGKSGFLTLWGNQRPAWPEGGEPGQLSEADEQRMRRNMAIAQLVPVAAFAAILLAHLLG